jgi:hypothetical protein
MEAIMKCQSLHDREVWEREEWNGRREKGRKEIIRELPFFGLDFSRNTAGTDRADQYVIYSQRYIARAAVDRRVRAFPSLDAF